MAKTFLPYTVDQQLLLPPDMREWLPENHLAHFILDVVAGTAVSLFGLWVAVILDRHGDRVWNLVVPPSLRRVQA